MKTLFFLSFFLLSASALAQSSYNTVQADMSQTDPTKPSYVRNQPSITVGNVTALAAGAAPTVAVNKTNGNFTFSFGIPAGSTGLQGPTGAQGATGSTGATGLTGPTGPTGATGSQGTAGTNGTNGSNGATGATGATGAAGSTGAQGATGAQGPAGTDNLPLITLNNTSTFSFNTSGLNETIYTTNGSLISAGTINLPSITATGETLRYVCKSGVTLVTLNGTVLIGSTLVSLSADSSVAYQAINTTGSFIRIQ